MDTVKNMPLMASWLKAALGRILDNFLNEKCSSRAGFF